MQQIKIFLKIMFVSVFLYKFIDSCIPTEPILMEVTTTTTLATTTTYPCPAGWTYLFSTNDCYIVFPHVMLDFYAGEAFCQSLGATSNLATANTPEEIDLLLGLSPTMTQFPLNMQNPPYIWTNNQLLLGGYDVGNTNDNVFAWIDGTPWNAQALGIYNNFFTENCIELNIIQYAFGPRGKLNDMSCNTLIQNVACEMPA